jgi:hypothetical protein
MMLSMSQTKLGERPLPDAEIVGGGDGIDAAAAHQAFLEIDEYRQHSAALQDSQATLGNAATAAEA